MFDFLFRKRRPASMMPSVPAAFIDSEVSDEEVIGAIRSVPYHYVTPPTPTPRTPPTGYKMPSGWKMLLTFASRPALQLWEIETTPGALDGGAPVETSTMHNNKWHTAAARNLIRKGEAKYTCMYDPDAVNDIIAIINPNLSDTVTETFPTGDTLCYYGYLQHFDFGGMKEGDRPVGTATVAATNTDAAQLEAGPVYTAAAGT